MIKEWRDVVGYQGFYKVSNTGIVKSLCRDGSDGRPKRKGRRLSVNHYKSCTVSLYVDGEKNKQSVSNLVAEAFIGKRPKGMMVIHLDGNYHNNHVDNLVYGPLTKVRKLVDDRLQISRLRDVFLTQKVVHDHFTYKTGLLFYKRRTSTHINIGDKAGYMGNKWSRRIKIGTQYYLISKIIYLYHYGVFPDGIKYLDNNVKNTNIENLQAV